jgi:hypothetical protein
MAAGNKGSTADAWATAIALDPNDGQTLFVSVDWEDASGNAMTGVFKSIDYKQKWVPIDFGDFSCVDPGRTAAFAFVDPAQLPNTLYAAGQFGVRESTDGGLSWVTKNDGLPASCTALAIAIDPQDPEIRYCAVTPLDGAVNGSDVFRWCHGGPWQATGLGQSSSALAIDAKGQALYAGTGDGVFKRKPFFGATRWSQLAATALDPQGIFPKGCVQALLADPSDCNTVFAGTEDGVFWTSDGGLSWVAMNSGLTNFQSLADVQSTNVHALGLRNGAPKTLYAGIDGGVLSIQL